MNEVQWQIIPSNPASRVAPSKASKKKIDYYDEQETSQMLTALENEDLKWKVIVYIAIVNFPSVAIIKDGQVDSIISEEITVESIISAV